jgi:5-methylthioribose kinase
VIAGRDGFAARELAGGVSNVVLAVSTAHAQLVVKQALPRLRVEDEWLAKRERAITEARALEFAARITPGTVPALVDLDRDRCALTIAAAPPSWVPWKSRLLRGEADAAIASRLGAILAAWHRASFQDETAADLFGDYEAFAQLRVDPYYWMIVGRRPELSPAVASVVAGMQAARVCLVHGDYSPKNILVGDGGIWVIDFEVAHYGDPAFDVAFMLNHLLLKRLHVPAAGVDLERCALSFWRGYEVAVGEKLLPDARYIAGHLGCLMVARVDGKSPAEYLSPPERESAVKVGTQLLLAPPDSLEDVLALVADALR